MDHLTSRRRQRTILWSVCLHLVDVAVLRLIYFRGTYYLQSDGELPVGVESEKSGVGNRRLAASVAVVPTVGSVLKHSSNTEAPAVAGEEDERTATSICSMRQRLSIIPESSSPVAATPPIHVLTSRAETTVVADVSSPVDTAIKQPVSCDFFLVFLPTSMRILVLRW